MKLTLLLFSSVCYCFLFGQIFASTGGIVGVISPRLMYDGRPVLWQSLDSDSSNLHIRFFTGARYNFLGLVNGADSSRVYAGLNTAGFAIVFSKLKGNDSETLYDPEAILTKQALGECGRLEDFNRFITSTEIKVGSNSSFACLDAFDSYRIYEAGDEIRVAFDLKESLQGFLVRANFNFTDPQWASKSYWRYHRARELFTAEKLSGKLRHHIIVKKFARDLQSIEMDPYPLPFQAHDSVPTYVQCENCINQYNTVSCVVIHGVRPGENPDFSTMWVILGEPICGVAVPLWPATSQVPLECQLSGNSLNNIFQAQKRDVYGQSSRPQFLNSQALLRLRERLNDVENSVYAETYKALARWRERDNYLQDMIDFQLTTSSYVYRALK